MDFKELTERQKWTLNQKIDHSVGTIEAFVSGTGKVPFVSYSGGKDSTVLLHLARRYVDKNMKAVFCNTGNEYPEIVQFVRNTENVTIIRPEMTVSQVIKSTASRLYQKSRHKVLDKLKLQKVRSCVTFVCMATTVEALDGKLERLPTAGSFLSKNRSWFRKNAASV